MDKIANNSRIVHNVACIMATYNGEKFLDEQLITIKNQLDCNVDIFVSDDNSLDGTICILRDNVKEIVANSGKPGAASNFFNAISYFDVSGYDYICFADQDDIWLPNKLKIAIHEIISTDADFYSGSVFGYWDELNNVKYVNKYNNNLRCDYFFEGGGPGCTYVLSKKLYAELKKFVIVNNDVRSLMWHDWFIYAFARSRKFNTYISNKPHILYRQHSSNDTGLNLGFSSKLKRLKLFLNGKYIYNIYRQAEILGYSNELHITLTELFFKVKFRRRSIESLQIKFLLTIFIVIKFFKRSWF